MHVANSISSTVTQILESTLTLLELRNIGIHCLKVLNLHKTLTNLKTFWITFKISGKSSMNLITKLEKFLACNADQNSEM